MLEDLLNKVWDLGWQAHKASTVKGNKIDPIEFRKKATDEAKTEVIKALDYGFIPDGHEATACLNHKNYTAACCGCQKKKAVINKLEVIKADLGLEK